MVATLLKPRPATLEVRLITVQARNNIVLTQHGQLINPHLPVWSNKKICTRPVPVAFNIGAAMRPQLEIQLAVGGNTGQGELEILAANGTLLFRGELNNSYVTALACFTPEGLAQLQSGLLFLQLVLANGTIVPLGSIPVEMYWINLCGIPDSMHKNGMPVELLSGLCETVTLAGYFPSEAAYMYPVPSIVQRLSDTVSRLQKGSGTPLFITANSFDQITLHYNAWLAAVKCTAVAPGSYDIAAVLQYLLTCYGYKAYYSVIQQQFPLHVTESSHAFVYLPAYGVAADAATGPHLGYEMLSDYVVNNFDCPEDDAVPYSGVCSVEHITSLHQIPELLCTQEFLLHTGMDARAFVADANKTIAGKWPAAEQVPYLKGGWYPFYQEIVPGKEEVLRITMLRRGNNIMILKLYVSSGGNELAFNRFIAQGGITQGTSLPLHASVAGLGYCAACSNNENENRYVWVYHNAVLDIYSSDASADLSVVAAWYLDWADNHLVNDVQLCLPAADIDYTGNGAVAGEQFMITLNAFENTLLHFSQSGDGSRLVSREPHCLIWEILNPSIASMDVMVLDTDTLLVNNTTVLPAFITC